MLWWFLPLLLLVVVLLLPIGLRVGYQEQQWNVLLKLGPAKLSLYPSKKENKHRGSLTPGAGKAKRKEKDINAELHSFLPIFQTLFAFLSDFRKSVRINDLLIRIILGESDPCDLSIHYGYTCAAIANLLPHLNNLLHIKKQKIDVSCNYLSEQSTIVGLLDLSLPAVLLLKLLIRYGLRILKQYRSIKNQRKGGSAYEPESSSNA